MYDPEDEIDAVNWSDFSTAYGVANDVPTLLKMLFGSDTKKAKDAAHELWCGLCHQHAYVSSAALPSYPILLKSLDSATSEVAVEILDILWGLAQCSAPDFGIDPSQRTDWMAELHNQMKADKEIFETLANSKNDDVRDFASWISEELNKTR